MSSATQYIGNLQLNDRLLSFCCDGLNHEETLLQLPFPGNCMNWNLGHLLVYREQIMGMIDGETEPNEDEFAIYGAGSEPLTDGANALPMDQLLTRLGEASARVIAGLEQMDDARLHTVINEERGLDVDNRLRFYIVFHEGLHLGQMQMLREFILSKR